MEAEIRTGMGQLVDLGPAVAIFGTARCAPGTANYEETKALASMLAKAGFAIITGGGPGCMQAANEGAVSGGGRSVGVAIRLQHEEKPNPFQTDSLTHQLFPTRKVIFWEHASMGVICRPGGLGTLDELTEILTLIQCGCAHKVPVILMGVRFWQPFLEFLEKSLLASGYISPGDLELFTVTDDPHEVVAALVRFRSEQETQARVSLEPDPHWWSAR